MFAIALPLDSRKGNGSKIHELTQQQQQLHIATNNIAEIHELRVHPADDSIPLSSAKV